MHSIRSGCLTDELQKWPQRRHINSPLLWEMWWLRCNLVLPTIGGSRGEMIVSPVAPLEGTMLSDLGLTIRKSESEGSVGAVRLLAVLSPLSMQLTFIWDIAMIGTQAPSARKRAYSPCVQCCLQRLQLMTVPDLFVLTSGLWPRSQRARSLSERTCVTDGRGTRGFRTGLGLPWALSSSPILSRTANNLILML